MLASKEPHSVHRTVLQYRAVRTVLSVRESLSVALVTLRGACAAPMDTIHGTIRRVPDDPDRRPVIVSRHVALSDPSRLLPTVSVHIPARRGQAADTLHAAEPTRHGHS